MRVKRREFLISAGATAGIGAVRTTKAQESPTIQMITEGDTYYFDPIGLFIEPGTTVTFENAAGSHNSVSYADRIPSEASEWSTPVGETATVTFEEVGTYDYYCAPHKTLGMVGRIVVGESGGPAAGSIPPDGEVPASNVIVENGSVAHDAFVSGEDGGDGSENTGEASEGLAKPLVGTGLFAGITALAALIYWISNSEGERERVGSAAWKRRHEFE